MSSRNAKALATVIQHAGFYAPLIVRPRARRPGSYEIIDGHERAGALRQLGATKARCEVWNVDDDESDLLALSLNALRGRPDAKKRAELLSGLCRSIGEQETAHMLGLTPAAMAQHLAPLRSPKTRPAAEDDRWNLHAAVFHFSADQKKLLDDAIRAYRKAGMRKAEALAAALKAALAGGR